MSSTPDSTDFFKSKEVKLTEAPLPQADFYNMRHKNRGLALIFNHYKFESSFLNKRNGTNKDRDDLEKLLLSLKFDVRVFNDLTYIEILKELREAANLNHKDNDCLMVFVLSHGLNGAIYSYDELYKTKILWQQFQGDNCPSMAGKPKLFFIQACRGDKVDGGVQVLATDSEEDKLYSIPVMADILVMYGTAEGYFSWRNPENGSYFIQALIATLEEYCDKLDLLSILTLVNRKVAIDFSGNCEGGEAKQMCTIVSMLTRFVFFGRNK